MTLAWPEPTGPPPAGNRERFGGRWRFAGAGLSNVWRYGDLELPANSGRLLLRGPNGTGKTTVLEALWPYLLDLNPALLSAGKARNTTLSGLMREGSPGRRRVGYMWLTFASPGAQNLVSYGVRLNFSEGTSPPVKVTPFIVPGRPLHQLDLWAPGRGTLPAEAFRDAVAAAGGTTFEHDEHYVRDLAGRLVGVEPAELTQLSGRIRAVRNPALLGELSPRAAADALRESLPAVDEDVITATGEALAESDATREAFERDRAAATTLDDFARIWTGHAADVAANTLARADQAVSDARSRKKRRDDLARRHAKAVENAGSLAHEHHRLRDRQRDAEALLKAIEKRPAYSAAGRLQDLEATLKARIKVADQAFDALRSTAAGAERLRASHLTRLTNLADDVAGIVADATGPDPSLAPVEPLTWRERSRPVHHVGDKAVDPGPSLVVRADLGLVDLAVGHWQQRAAELTRSADAARLFVIAHKDVATAQRKAAMARRDAERLTVAAERQAAKANAQIDRARSEAAALCPALGEWLERVGDDVGWSRDDLDEVTWDEPPAVLAVVDRWVELTTAWAHATAAGARAHAHDLASDATSRRTEAAELRNEAQRIRDQGVLLDIPRPAWSGAGDDERALGAAIDWFDTTDTSTQDTIEATLAAAGVLGATMDDIGVTSDSWSVQLTGPVVEPNLTSVLRADPAHPLAQTAAGALARIALRPSATDGDDTPTLVIGRDGTFRTGVLAAAVPAARDGAIRPPAQHVGARRRREAALAHATRLDARAADLETEATGLEGAADRARAHANGVLGLLEQFPKTSALRDAESDRAAAVSAARDAEDAAAQAEAESDALAEQAGQAQRRWVAEVTTAGLPPDPDELSRNVDAWRIASTSLTTAANQFGQKLRPRIAALALEIESDDSSDQLTDRAARALTARDEAESTRTEHDALVESAGSAIADTLGEHSQASADLEQLNAQVEAADRSANDADKEAATLAVKLESAEADLAEAAPAAAEAIAELRRLLRAPGATEALLDAEPEGDDDSLLGQVGAALKSKPTSTKRTLRERADVVKAAVAGTWSLDPGPDHPELDTYVLTHRDATYTPVTAAAHARTLADRAEAALRTADEAALRDFVVGRLPGAVATAWTRLHDWRDEVNRKMRKVAASSGVAVSVRITVADDLSPAARTVYELVCKTGDALRSADARARAGAALQALIAAADGDDMTDRVRQAVDIRAWVDVNYEVIRPGQQPRTWTSRLGLSGGERRLVVLAPMIAAVAAAYDRFPEDSLRLAALDEVPAEVDEHGREGLARYLADLDLDLIATSYLWDGAPGAWDGVDAHDLEAGPDGTVVAFPMLVRGADLLPGDQLDNDVL